MNKIEQLRKNEEALDILINNLKKGPVKTDFYFPLDLRIRSRKGIIKPKPYLPFSKVFRKLHLKVVYTYSAKILGKISSKEGCVGKYEPNDHIIFLGTYISYVLYHELVHVIQHANIGWPKKSGISFCYAYEMGEVIAELAATSLSVSRDKWVPRSEAYLNAIACMRNYLEKMGYKTKQSQYLVCKDVFRKPVLEILRFLFFDYKKITRKNSSALYRFYLTAKEK